MPFLTAPPSGVLGAGQLLVFVKEGDEDCRLGRYHGGVGCKPSLFC